MRLLIANDGSGSSDAALDDLGRAGLGPKGEALIVSVAEVWLPPPNTEPDADRDETDDFIESIVKAHRQKGEVMVAEAESRAQEARDRISSVLPGWTVTTKATYGSPAWEILSAADEFHPDLIVVGSQGRSAISRFILGSVSQKVLTEAECSVRISRGRVEVDPSPIRIVIGFDGSAGAIASVDSVASRSWPKDTEVLLVVATDNPELERGVMTDAEWMAAYTKTAVDTLEKSGVKVETKLAEGNPNSVLVEQAELWHADSIFVGANAEGSRLERFLLGTTAAAVAARAHCSVEAVRKAA
jgi:nucleotide-binding universal stress UspA family protein